MHLFSLTQLERPSAIAEMCCVTFTFAEGRPIPCPACEGTFRTESHLLRHIKSSHPDLLEDDAQAKSVNSFIASIREAAAGAPITYAKKISSTDPLASFYYQKIEDESDDTPERDGQKRRNATVIQVWVVSDVISSANSNLNCRLPY